MKFRCTLSRTVFISIQSIAIYVQRTIAIIPLAGCCLISSGQMAEIPNNALLKRWLRTNEDFSIENIQPITLVGGEQAYLAQAFFPHRGHCCEDVTVLARPEIEEAREIAVLSQTLVIMDMDGDRVSEIEGHGSHIGQGWFEGIWQIYRLDGWEPVVLYEYGPVTLSNEGAGCGLREHDLYNRVCEQRTVTLCYEDLNQDGAPDLIQTVKEETFWFKAGTEEVTMWADESIRQQAIDPQSYKTRTSQQKYLYVRHAFIAIEP